MVTIPLICFINAADRGQKVSHNDEQLRTKTSAVTGVLVTPCLEWGMGRDS